MFKNITINKLLNKQWMRKYFLIFIKFMHNL